MAMFEVKFAYLTGYNLAFSAFQPSGDGRGIELQPLKERRPTGFYNATPITDLVAGDEVLVYNLDTLTWENDPLFTLTQDYLYWEGDRLYWGDDWLSDTDNLISDVLTYAGNPVGSGEFSSAIDITLILNDLLTGQTTVTYEFDSTGGGGQMQGRQISAGNLGYWPL
jgi:hypothetical protein